MKAIKTQIAIIFVCMALSFLIAPQLGAQDVPPEGIKAAEEGLPVYLELTHKVIEKKPSFKIEKLGFKKTDSIDQAYLGEAFRVYEIPTDIVLNYPKDTPVESVLSKTDLWYFPVMIENEERAILVVDKMKDSWRAVAFGSAQTAKGLAKIKRQWPKEEGYTPLLVQIYQPYMLLFTIPQYSAYNLTEIGAESYLELGDAYDVINGLHTGTKQ